MTPLTFIFIGRSGCGKGTQAALIQEHVEKNITPFRHVFCIETGERFRQFIKEHSHTSRLASEITEQGGRQPDFMAVWMWSNLLVSRMTGDEHVIFDGLPRSFPEAEILDTAVKFYKREKPIVVYLNIPRDVSKKRLVGRGRADDIHMEAIERRLNWFETDVAPAIEFYRNNSDYKFVELDGQKTVEELHQELLKAIS